MSTCKQSVFFLLHIIVKTNVFASSHQVPPHFHLFQQVGSALKSWSLRAAGWLTVALLSTAVAGGWRPKFNKKEVQEKGRKVLDVAKCVPRSKVRSSLLSILLIGSLVLVAQESAGEGAQNAQRRKLGASAPLSLAGCSLLFGGVSWRVDNLACLLPHCCVPVCLQQRALSLNSGEQASWGRGKQGARLSMRQYGKPICLPKLAR